MLNKKETFPIMYASKFATHSFSCFAENMQFNIDVFVDLQNRRREITIFLPETDISNDLITLYGHLTIKMSAKPL